jgi:hypothetical protein
VGSAAKTCATRQPGDGTGGLSELVCGDFAADENL